MFQKGSIPQGRRCVKKRRIKRPSSSCIVEDTEREAGNGFKEKREVLSCSEPQSFCSVCCFVFLFFEGKGDQIGSASLTFCSACWKFGPGAAPQRPVCSPG